jgi:serine/threonine protein kinase
MASAPLSISSSGRTRKAIKVGAYVLLRTLGQGSSSEVKLARHSVTGEHVAVKVSLSFSAMASLARCAR